MRNLHGGEHVWDKRYKNDYIDPKHPQPFDSNNKMLVGKYAGRKVDTLPVDYHKWLLKNWNNLSVRNINKLMHLVQLACKSA